MQVSDFDFFLPPELIATKPAPARDKCRLLVLKKDARLEHRRFSDLAEYLNEGDMLLLNNTKVLPARLSVKKLTGGKIELLLVKELKPNVWELLSRDRYTGKIFISGECAGELFDGKIAKFNAPGMETVWKAGQMPLPPYIKRKPTEADKEWYQTVYAEQDGSIAAPTAGLHFTKDLISFLEQKGIIVRYLTLHVGPGTFKPIKVEILKDHCMDSEYFEIAESLIDAIKNVKASGKKIFSVGTTTTRAIEGYMSGQWSETPKSQLSAPNSQIVAGSTDIFIYPGYAFKVVDSLITNFHLPKSTPLMLTSALGGVEKVHEAYGQAVSSGYRFFSYGDAMLIL